MSIVGLLCLVLAFIATLLFVLYWLKRREWRGVEQLFEQLQRIAIGGDLARGIDVHSNKPQVAALIAAIDQLQTRAAAAAERASNRAAPELFADLGERIHEAVLVHRDVILYANRQFASLVGVEGVELIGRRLSDLVPPEYSELVSDNIRARLAGEPAAERYEIDMVGLQGQVSRLEIASSLTRYQGDEALLITGVEIIPTQSVPALRVQGEAPLQLVALNSLAEAIIATDTQGRITYMNPAAEQLSGGVAQ